MKPQRLLNLSIVFLIPLILLAVLMTGAALAAPAAASNHNPTEFLPSDAPDSFSIAARRVISIPFLIENDNSAPPPSIGDQIVARRVISIPFLVDNSALPPSAVGL